MGVIKTMMIKMKTKVNDVLVYYYHRCVMSQTQLEFVITGSLKDVTG